MAKPLVDDTGLGALLRREVLIPGAHRQPICLPHGRADADLHRHVEVQHHVSHDGALHAVLLSEERLVRLHDVEQLRHDGAHASEEARPPPRLGGTLNDALRHHKRPVLGSVHRLEGRSQDDVHAGVAEALHIGIQTPGIAVEVLVGPELGRIHEDRSHLRPHEGL
eukprot:scaffold803_cov310-Pinguiococcus_pyrenoidosus.AAC.39